MIQISLPEDQQDWLQTQVRDGRFPSVEGAIAAAIALLQAEDDPTEDDAVRPLIAQAIASADRGDVFEWDMEEIKRTIHARNPDLVNGKDTSNT